VTAERPLHIATAPTGCRRHPEGHIYADPSRRHRLVLADQTAEDIDAAHIPDVGDELAVGHTRRGAQMKAAVRSPCVVVMCVSAKHVVEMSSAADEREVEELVSHRAHEALGEGAGLGDLTGVRMTRMPSVRSTSSNGPRELGVAIADEEAHGFLTLIKRVAEVARLLGDESAVWVRRRGRDVDTARADLDEEEPVECLEEYGLDGEEVAGEDALGLERRNSDQLGRPGGERDQGRQRAEASSRWSPRRAVRASGIRP